MYRILLILSLAARATAALVLTNSVPDGVSAAGSSSAPVISADGRYVAFLSSAQNLTTNVIPRGSLNVFWRDVVASNTVLVSATPVGKGASGTCSSPVISTNGGIIAFASDTADLVAGDTNGIEDVFVCPIPHSYVSCVSTDEFGKSVGGNNPLLSANGLEVFFESSGAITSEATNGATVVFVRDLGANEASLLSKKWDGGAPTKSSTLADVTPDGRFVAFLSMAAGEITQDNSNALGVDAFVLNRNTDNMVWVSRLTNYFPGGYTCHRAALSADGKYVVVAASDTPTTASIFRSSVGSGAIDPVAVNIPLPSESEQISADGRYILYRAATNIFRWDATTGTNELVNLTITNTPPAIGTSRDGQMTPDGNGIAFLSDSPLVTNSAFGFFQLYTRDMSNAVTRLVTARPDGSRSAQPTVGGRFVLTPDFSRIAFESPASDLVSGDSNGVPDIFARDLDGLSTTLVSARDASLSRATKLQVPRLRNSGINHDASWVVFSGMDQDVNPTNFSPVMWLADLNSRSAISLKSLELRGLMSISGDSRYIAVIAPYQFYSFLVRYERETASTTNIVRVFRSWWEPAAPAISFDGNITAIRGASFNGFSLFNLSSNQAEISFNNVAPIQNRSELVDALISPDSRFVVFNGLSGSSGSLNIFDRQTRQLETNAAGVSPWACVSGNSRFVVFQPGVGGGIIKRDMLAHTNQVFAENLTELSVTDDGRYIAGRLITSTSRILVIDSTTGSRMPIAEGATTSYPRNPIISPNGRFVTYLGEAGATGAGHRQILLRDLRLGTTTTLSVNGNGEEANEHVTGPLLSSDGSTLFFQTAADNLALGDYNGASDIFFAKLGGRDSDADGMDDDWEVTFFGNLSGDGSGDWDGDGVSDQEEFLAGTDPTNSGSVFRAFIIKSIGDPANRITWSAVPGRAYRVEFKDDLVAGGWTALDAAISWSGSTAWTTDTTPGPHRFYRIIRLP